MRFPFLLVPAFVFAAACGPALSSDDDGADDDSGDAPDATPGDPEICTGGADEDGDGYTDCDDADCIGTEACPSDNPNCGELNEVTGSLALPDGEGNSYTNALNFTGFSAGQTLDDITKLLGVCVNMEHSWLRDLQMEITCPNNTKVVLNMFLGQTGSEVFMGQPNETDEGTNVTPIPGVGADYCWTPTAANAPMLDYANATGVHDLPTGDYQASTPFSALVGCPLNGDWTIKVQDLWAIDNGFIFSWGIKFDPSIVEDCTTWPQPD